MRSKRRSVMLTIIAVLAVITAALVSFLYLKQKSLCLGGIVIEKEAILMIMGTLILFLLFFAGKPLAPFSRYAILSVISAVWLVSGVTYFGESTTSLFSQFNSYHTSLKLSDGTTVLLSERHLKSSTLDNREYDSVHLYKMDNFLVNEIGEFSDLGYTQKNLIENNKFSYDYDNTKKQLTIKLDYGDFVSSIFWPDSDKKKPEFMTESFIIK